MTTTDFQAQKLLSRALDRASLRAETIGKWGATPKQCWYLAGLMLRAGENGSEYITSSHIVLTKRRASVEIDAFNAQLARQTVEA